MNVDVKGTKLTNQKSSKESKKQTNIHNQNNLANSSQSPNFFFNFNIKKFNCPISIDLIKRMNIKNQMNKSNQNKSNQLSKMKIPVKESCNKVFQDSYYGKKTKQSGKFIQNSMSLHVKNQKSLNNISKTSNPIVIPK